MNKTPNIHRLGIKGMGILTETQSNKKGVSRALPAETQPHLLLYHICLSIARGKLKFAEFRCHEQKYFVNFVDFGYCNSRENVVYYSHNKGGTVQW